MPSSLRWHRSYPRARISHCRDASPEVSKPLDTPSTQSPPPIASQFKCIDLKRNALNRCRFCSCKIVLEVAFLQFSRDCCIYHRLRLQRRPLLFLAHRFKALRFKSMGCYLRVRFAHWRDGGFRCSSIARFLDEKHFFQPKGDFLSTILPARQPPVSPLKGGQGAAVVGSAER